MFIASLAFVLSLVQFFKDNNRNRKESTLNAYKELQQDFVIIKSLKDSLDSIKRTSGEWIKITTCLANLENFCVGINTGIYDIKVLNRLGGGFFIEQYQLLKPIIEEKRKREDSKKIYEEFEKTVYKLWRLRK